MVDSVKELILNIQDPTPSEKKLAKKLIGLDIMKLSICPLLN